MLKTPTIVLVDNEIEAFILCFINFLELKQIINKVNIHRLIYIASKAFYIKNLNLDFKMKGYLGPYSEKLESHINNLINNKLLINDEILKNKKYRYFVSNKGKEYYIQTLLLSKRRKIFKISKKMDYYNEISNRELYFFCIKLQNINLFFNIMQILIYYIMYKASSFYCYYFFKNTVNLKNKNDIKNFFKINKI